MGRGKFNTIEELNRYKAVYESSPVKTKPEFPHENKDVGYYERNCNKGIRLCGYVVP